MVRNLEKLIVNHFASVSSSKTQETTSIGVNPQLSPPPSSTIGSPLFWIGVGVGLSALFSVLSSRLKVNVTLCIDIDGSLYEFEYNSARCNKVV
ncbi:protein TIC 40, chloroplastic-like isoform X4 [Vigna unguiculata]|uniref:protein TIC 40, chloroplastic-like isoform X4 n=1 Tax=Vigna unguiculata TaxID=3917 RepID=UPI001016479F|nr:protein TIC 40, chloroplastic-like isoform X4 [Vigna unguiculata]